jgi:hypothetical protein
MIEVTTASCTRHLADILALQRRYHARNVPAEVQAMEGFVFAEYSLDLLRRMAAQSPQAIALSAGRVVGYCLSLPTSFREELPSVAPMFEQFDRCSYQGKPLSDWEFIVGGQVCVDRDHRGHRLLARLYEQIRLALPRCFELCVTEVATRNEVSLRAHEKMGFEIISTYRDPQEEWAVVAWDLSRPALLTTAAR